MKYSRYNVWAELEGHVGLFNGLTGAFAVMTPDERAAVDAFVDGSGTGESVADLLARLVRMRALGTDDHVELDELRGRYDASRWRSGHLGYTVVTSLGCNFDCPYCFEDKHPSLIKPAVADALVDLLVDSLPTVDGLTVTWMGGEPLIGLKQLLKLSDRLIEVCEANDKTYSASIITNGWYLDAPTAIALSQRKVASAQVTIDGPPDVHDRTRPHANGGSTFDRILRNIQEAADHIDIHIRVNVDTANAHRLGELVEILAAAGLAGRVNLGLGKITDATSNQAAPVASYTSSCLTGQQFGELDLTFNAIAEAHGFGYPSTPKPVSTPCTAVRSGEIVVGADGELWKCWDDIGDPSQSIGSVFDYEVSNDNLGQWLEYHPADDPQCSTCVAMPVCMGGCAHHDFHSTDREARCGSFRHNHVARITEALRRAVGLEPGPIPELPRFDAPAPPTATPVVLGPRRGTRLPQPA